MKGCLSGLHARAGGGYRATPANDELGAVVGLGGACGVCVDKGEDGAGATLRMLEEPAGLQGREETFLAEEAAMRIGLLGDGRVGARKRRPGGQRERRKCQSGCHQFFKVHFVGFLLMLRRWGITSRRDQ